MSGLKQRLPLQVDPYRLAAKEEHLEGTIPLKQMKRLLEAVEIADGEINVDVKFGIDDLNVVFLAGNIKTEVALICQRCMEVVVLPIDINAHVAFVRGEAEMESLPEGYEGCLINEVPVMLSDIIEDEILLALPVVPKHPVNKCPAEDVNRARVEQWNSQQAVIEENEDVEKENPFNILAGLKVDKQDEA